MKLIVSLAAPLVLLAADPSAFELRKADIRAMLTQCDYAAARKQAAALNREWPDDIVGYQFLAAANLGLGNYDEAEKALQWMLDLRIGKADAAGWLLVARFREATGDLDGALEAADAAFGKMTPERENQRPAMVAYAGHLQILAGKLANAEALLNRAAELASDDPAVLEGLARLRLAQDRRAEAARIFEELARTTGHPRFLYEAKDYSNFEQSARKRIDSTDNANRELALFYAGPGRHPTEALRIARLEADRRNDPRTLDALAVALSANGKTEEARAVMKQALASGTRLPGILAHAAELGMK